MPVTVKPRQENADKSTEQKLPTLDEIIRKRLAACPYVYYFNKVTWCFDRGLLTLDGSVPTFYLKQMLQTILRDVEHVDHIRNNVDVVSSTGLSSVRPR